MLKLYIYIVILLAAIQNIFAQSFQDKLDVCLNSKLKEYSNYEYQILNMPKAYTSIEINEDGDFRLSGNLYYIPVVVNNDLSKVKTYIQLRVKLSKDVFYAANNIDKNKNFTNQDIQVKNVDVTQLKGKPVYSLDKILESRSKFFIKSGDIISEEMLARVPVVLRDTKVKAYLLKGNLEISIDAVAKQEGCQGDIISIQTVDKKKYNARVIDQYNVNIIE